MKPRAFIGSSVEGLGVAYAVQQNLVHQAETTVWDQGIFNLSSTTIESLIKILDKVDFAIFVFSPDDVTQIRGTTIASVRDNVLFELGLFIGKLGRERVFFLIPDGADIRIPTDLLGVTPGKFDSNRQDGSMQAATGPVCHLIRTQIDKLGLFDLNRQETPEPEKPVQEDKTESWLSNLVKEQFTEAKDKLNDEIKKSNDEKKYTLRGWLLYTEMLENRSIGITPLLQLATEKPTDAKLQSLVMEFLTWEEHYSDAIKLHANLEHSVKAHADVVTALAQCHAAAAHPQDAIDLLAKQNTKANPEYALLAAKIYENDDKNDKAMDIIYEALSENPSHEALRYRFANLSMDSGNWEIALYLLSGLTYDFPKNSDYLAYFANCCICLNLYDTALTSYQHADEMSSGKESWIAGNIGNLFSAKDLPSEAIIHLKRAINLHDTGQYAYERMAEALKKKGEEDKLLDEKRTNGKLLFQNFAQNREKELQGKFESLATLSALAQAKLN